MERRMTRTRQPRSPEPCGRFQGEDQEGFEERFINEFIAHPSENHVSCDGEVRSNLPELEKWRNEWTRSQRITEYEPFCDEDYDVEQFLRYQDWEEENTSTYCDGSEDENCDQEVKNNSKIKDKMERKQLSDKNSVSEEKDESCQAPSKRRKKRPCPLKGCKSQVIDLPRHLRDVHKWSREKAQKATSKFGLRKSFSSKVVEKGKESKWKDYHHHRKCPVSGCYSTVKRFYTDA